MNIDWIIPCRYAEVHDNPATIVGAGIDTFWLPQLPAPLQVSIVVRLQGLPEELNQDVVHQVRNIIIGPDGEKVGEMGAEVSFGIATQDAERQDWLQGVILPTVIGFEAATEGTNTFEHIVDGSSASVPLHVIHGAPGTPPAPPAEG